MSKMITLDIGSCSYSRTLDLQQKLVQRIRDSKTDDIYLVLVEHDPPVITMGRRAKAEHVRMSRAMLEARGVDFEESSRGGDVTYHGPGQLVAYPILQLDTKKRTMRGHVERLEHALLGVLSSYGLDGVLRKGFTGAWVGDEKVAAIGVAVSRWVAYHGLALNVSSNLSGFEMIVPCGLASTGITSISKLLGREVSVLEAKGVLVENLAREYDAPDLVAESALAVVPGWERG